MKEKKLRIGIAIDESGTPNIENIKQETNHFCLGAAVYNYDKYDVITEEINKIKTEVNHDKEIIHFREIKSRKKKQEISKLIGEMDSKIYLFGIISNKDTLGEYRRFIDNNHKKYYNKCLMYLFERIGELIGKLKYKNINVEIENIAIEESICNLNMAKSYLNACKKTPHRKETENLRNFDFGKLETVKKSHNSILQLSDFMASSVRACINGGIIEGTGTPRYIYWMRKKYMDTKKRGE